MSQGIPRISLQVSHQVIPVHLFGSKLSHVKNLSPRPVYHSHHNKPPWLPRPSSWAWDSMKQHTMNGLHCMDPRRNT
eukprot:5045991-Ditylum_brightwellii.AAC.1